MINWTDAPAIIAALISLIISAVMMAGRYWKARRKMKPEELRRLAAGLEIEARRNIQIGMGAMNPAAPFARGPQPQPAVATLRLLVSSAHPVPSRPQPDWYTLRRNA